MELTLNDSTTPEVWVDFFYCTHDAVRPLIKRIIPLRILKQGIIKAASVRLMRQQFTGSHRSPCDLNTPLDSEDLLLIRELARRPRCNPPFREMAETWVPQMLRDVVSCLKDQVWIEHCYVIWPIVEIAQAYYDTPAEHVRDDLWLDAELIACLHSADAVKNEVRMLCNPMLAYGDYIPIIAHVWRILLTAWYRGQISIDFAYIETVNDYLSSIPGSQGQWKPILAIRHYPKIRVVWDAFRPLSLENELAMTMSQRRKVMFARGLIPHGERLVQRIMRIDDHREASARTESTYALRVMSDILRCLPPELQCLIGDILEMQGYAL